VRFYRSVGPIAESSPPPEPPPEPPPSGDIVDEILYGTTGNYILAGSGDYLTWN
jgi:hypothetical protein